MAYQEAVQNKLKATGERVAKRTDMWHRVVEAYGRGMGDEVAGEVETVLTPMREEFQRLLEGLRRNL